MTLEELKDLPNGTILCVEEVGEEWEKDFAIPQRCVKINERLYKLEGDDSEWYSYFSIYTMNIPGYELDIWVW